MEGKLLLTGDNLSSVKYDGCSLDSLTLVVATEITHRGQLKEITRTLRLLEESLPRFAPKAENTLKESLWNESKN